MRAHGQTKLGFYPLPPAETNRLRSWLNFQEPFSALDPCAGDGVAFVHLLRNPPARRYGIEIDAYRAKQARSLEIETLQANTMDVRCPADSLSLLYLNPPYDWEAGSTNNQRLEAVFLDHTYRWLKPGGVLLGNPGAAFHDTLVRWRQLRSRVRANGCRSIGHRLLLPSASTLGGLVRRRDRSSG
jgi:hypothetical protein